MKVLFLATGPVQHGELKRWVKRTQRDGQHAHHIKRNRLSVAEAGTVDESGNQSAEHHSSKDKGCIPETRGRRSKTPPPNSRTPMKTMNQPG